MSRGAAAEGRAARGKRGDTVAVDLGPLPEHLGYALRRAQLVAFADVIATLQSVHLSPGEYSMLTVIAQNPGIRPSDLGAALAIQKANLVPVLAALDRRGFIDRRAAATDGRALALYLTAEGRRLLQRARRLQARHEERLAAKLGPRGRHQLLRLLNRLSQPA